MSATVTDERTAFRAAIRTFAARECGSREQRDRLTDGGRDSHHQPLYEQMAELDWLGCFVPEEHGGAGGTVADAVLLLEELARGLVPSSGLGTSMIVANTTLKFGTEEQKQDVVGGYCRGEVISIAMSEPGAGSDVGALACRAEKVEGGYVVNGQKTWISSAHHANRVLLVCRTGRGGAKHEGISMLDVPAGAEGMETRLIGTMGPREVNDVFFTDCFVPEGRLLGTEGGGWPQLMSGLNFERLVTAAIVLGRGQRAFDDALAYVRERHQFGQPIGSFQALKHRLADLATELECCRLLVDDVARRAEEDPDRQLPREASMVKLKVSETARRVALEGMQMMGGYGYATEYDMEGHVRALLPSTVYAGTSEVQREIIGKTLGL